MGWILEYLLASAGLGLALVIVGLWLERRNPVFDDGHGAPHVPMAYVVAARPSPTVT
jgi:hypothetical protein